MWLIEENARIFFKLIKFNLETLLIMAEVIIIKIVNELFIMLNINKIIGATFCQVKIIIELNHVKP